MTQKKEKKEKKEEERKKIIKGGIDYPNVLMKEALFGWHCFFLLLKPGKTFNMQNSQCGQSTDQSKFMKGNPNCIMHTGTAQVRAVAFKQ